MTHAVPASSPRPTDRRRAPVLRRAVVLGAALAVAAAGCSTSHTPQDSLSPAGPESRFINHLFWPVFWIAVAMFFLVAGLAIYCIVRFRERPGNDRPRQVHGSPRLEITWTIIPALLLIGVGTFSVAGIFHLARNPKGADVAFQPASATTPATITGDVLRVNVIAHRWWFEFDYPSLGGHDPDAMTKADDAIVTAGELHIPAGKNVFLTITSNEPQGTPEKFGPGVIHNFWVPKLAGKIYAEPGRLSHLIINADKPGRYPGQCTEFCGISHANMRFMVVAESTSDFAGWVANQLHDQSPLTAADQFSSPQAYAGYQIFMGAGNCKGCHSVDGTPAQARVGPNLTHLQARSGFAGYILPINDNNLRSWLRNPQAVKPGANMRIPKLTEDQITALIAYLDTLK